MYTRFCYHWVNKRNECSRKSAFRFRLLFNFDWPETVNCILVDVRKEGNAIAVKTKLTGCWALLNFEYARWVLTHSNCRNNKRQKSSIFPALHFLISAFVLYFQNRGCKSKAAAFTIVRVYLHAFPHASIFQQSQIARRRRKSGGSRISRTEVISINLYTWRLQTSKARPSSKWERMACQSVSY